MKRRVAIGRARDDSFKNFVLDQLQQLDGVHARAMFGGHGLYRNEIFFGIVHNGRIYFKTDADTVAEYERAGMKPFRPSARQTLKSYYEVPLDILEDRDRLVRWAQSAMKAQSRRG